MNNNLFQIRTTGILVKLTEYGFSKLFQDIVKKGFLNAGNYMGLKSSIGL